MSDGRRQSGPRLSALGVRKLRKPGKHHDGVGHGLCLLMTPSGAKRWEQRITSPSGRRVTLGQGRYPDVSLRQARERALRVCALVVDDVDPILERRTPAVPTFAELVEEEIRARRSGWKRPDVLASRWRQVFERHVPDEVYLVETESNLWCVYLLAVDGECVPFGAANVMEIPEGDLLDLRNVARDGGRPAQGV